MLRSHDWSDCAVFGRVTCACSRTIDSSRGVTHVAEIVGGSPRVNCVESGPSCVLELGNDSLTYARGECELHARADGVVFVDTFLPDD